MRSIRLRKICDDLSLQLVGNDVIINGLNLCNRKSLHNKALSYVTSENYLECLFANEAISAVVLDSQLYELCKGRKTNREFSYIIVDNPEKIFYDIHEYLISCGEFYEQFDFDTSVGVNCVVEKTAVVEAGVIIGDNVRIGHNSVIRRGSVIDDNCIIGCNTTIGSEGFQILKIEGENRRISHVGGVRICEGALIGDNVTICNSLFEGFTYIGVNACIDNLSYVAHNSYVGDGAIVTAGNILCGSSVIMDNVWIGVNSSILNRVTVGTDAKVGMGSVVTRDIPSGVLAYGVPARHKE